MTIRSYIEQIQYPGKVSKRNLHAGSSSIHAATLASIDCVAVSCDFLIPEAVNNTHHHGATCTWSPILTHNTSLSLISAEVLFTIRTCSSNAKCDGAIPYSHRSDQVGILQNDELICNLVVVDRLASNTPETTLQGDRLY